MTVADPTLARSSRISGGARGRGGEGRVKGATRSSMVVATGCIFSSRFIRDWAWAALEALALNRSTKAWRWARSASCLALADSCSRAFSARAFSKAS
jgi:hypothetical protein